MRIKFRTDWAEYKQGEVVEFRGPGRRGDATARDLVELGFADESSEALTENPGQRFAPPAAAEPPGEASGGGQEAPVAPAEGGEPGDRNEEFTG